MKVTTHAAVGERVHWSEIGGMGVYVMPRAGRWQKCALLSVDFGAIDRELWLAEDAVSVPLPPGVAHFLEHRLFEKTSGDITERFTREGAEADADTTFTQTSFGVGTQGCLYGALELLLELAFTATFEPQGVEREREIIAREIQLSADSLDWVGYFRALDTVFHGQPVTDDIAGTVSDLSQIDADLLRLCHERLYRGGNASLFVCGDVDPAEVCARIGTWMARNPSVSRGASRALRRAPFPTLPVQRKESTLSISRSHLTLAFRDHRPRLEGDLLLRRELSLEMALYILFGPSSQLYGELYERGIIDSASFGFEVSAEPTFGVCLLGGETRAPAQLEDALAAALERAAREGLDPVEFELARRKAYGDIIRSFDSPEGCVGLMHNAVSCGAEPFDLLGAYARVRVDEANECLQSCLRAPGYGCSLIQPGAQVR